MKGICFKKLLFLLLLVFFLLNNAYGEETARNTIFFGTGISFEGLYFLMGNSLVEALQLYFEYEYSFNNKFSLSGCTGLQPWFGPFFEVKGRWYPWGKIFFIGLGSGIYYNTILSADNNLDKVGLVITPSLGWKKNVNEENKIFIKHEIFSRFGINYSRLFQEVIIHPLIPAYSISVGFYF